jgi:aspartyl-tRNA(Asn)/glutamyl-tRNA(Gln) amidotransferase subunit A
VAKALAGPNAQKMAEQGAALSAAGYLGLIETIEEFRRKVTQAFNGFDMLLTPAAAALPWPAAEAYPETIAGEKVGPRGHAVYSGWVNACGHPAVSLPCVPSANGLPIGLQLVAGFAQDELLLALAEQYEGAAPWSERWPDLALNAGST